MTTKEMGTLIAQRRKLFTLTQDDLAEMAGISANSVRKIERGQTNPTVEILLKLGQVLGFRIELTILHTI
ncbi:MAG: helix-turn-helix domain-containing protein [Lewinella sp.]